MCCVLSMHVKVVFENFPPLGKNPVCSPVLCNTFFFVSHDVLILFFRRIVYQEHSHSFAVAAYRIDVATQDDPRTFKPLRQRYTKALLLPLTPKLCPLNQLQSTVEFVSFPIFILLFTPPPSHTTAQCQHNTD